MTTSANRLLSLGSLVNRYHALRHGHSRANQQGIIVSDPANGCRGFGLSSLGRAQLRETLDACDWLPPETIIISSDFTRARETAEMVCGWIGCDLLPQLDERLRERFFGVFELAADSAYADIWQADARDPEQETHGVESPNAVMRRVTEVVAECEHGHHDRDILLISHGDALQILQAAFHRLDASRHRELPHLQTAEIRSLSMTPESSSD